jgi:PAS domain S-box-containing protein
VFTSQFSIDSSNHDSNMVSPEESVDGNPPGIDASAVAYHATAGLYVTQQMAPLHGISLSSAPPGLMYSSMGVPQVQNLGMLHHHIPGSVANSSIAPVKRRRLETGEATGSSSGMSKEQQLASVAEQAFDQARMSKKSPVQADRRRERNRILARRTRLRKKFFFEGLQKEVMDLQRENDMLKDVVRSDIGGDEGKRILDSCDAVQRMPAGVLEACCEGGLDFDSQDFNLVKSIQTSQQSFIITDPSLTDNPIVFASDGFLEVTGYNREQVLGRNCRFLQGTDTNKETVEEMRKKLMFGEDVSVTILNYTADGTPFWNKQFIAALRDAQNNIVNYIGVVVKVASPEPGHPDFGKFVSSGVNDDMDTNETKKEPDDAGAAANRDQTAENALTALADSASTAVTDANQNLS